MRRLFYLGISHSLLFLYLNPKPSFSTPFSLTLRPELAWSTTQKAHPKYFGVATLFFISDEITENIEAQELSLKGAINRQMDYDQFLHGGTFTHYIFMKRKPELPPNITVQLEYSDHHPLSLINILGDDKETHELFFVLRKTPSDEGRQPIYFTEPPGYDQVLSSFQNIWDESFISSHFIVSLNDFNKIEEVTFQNEDGEESEKTVFHKEPIRRINCINTSNDTASKIKRKKKGSREKMLTKKH